MCTYSLDYITSNCLQLKIYNPPTKSTKCRLTQLFNMWLSPHIKHLSTLIAFF